MLRAYYEDWSAYDEANLAMSLEERATDEAPQTDEGFWEDNGDDEIAEAIGKARAQIDTEAQRSGGEAETREILKRQEAYRIAGEVLKDAVPDTVARVMERFE